MSTTKRSLPLVGDLNHDTKPDILVTRPDGWQVLQRRADFLGTHLEKPGSSCTHQMSHEASPKQDNAP